MLKIKILLGIKNELLFISLFLLIWRKKGFKNMINNI